MLFVVFRKLCRFNTSPRTGTYKLFSVRVKFGVRIHRYSYVTIGHSCSIKNKSLDQAIFNLRDTTVASIENQSTTPNPRHDTCILPTHIHTHSFHHGTIPNTPCFIINGRLCLRIRPHQPSGEQQTIHSVRSCPCYVGSSCVRPSIPQWLMRRPPS